jgi:hypothetical protein
MAFLRRRANLAVVTVCLLAALAGGYLGDYFHTDDGCVVETHCLACQRQLSSIAVFSAHLAPLPPLAPLGRAVAPPTLGLLLARAHSEVSRGPPLV